jgi:predicted metal-dependent hydrolase
MAGAADWPEAPIPPSKAFKPRPKIGFAMTQTLRANGGTGKGKKYVRIVLHPAYLDGMSNKAERTGNLMAGLEAGRLEGQGIDRHYAGYFECFNRGLFYEAHDVLEPLWLAQRAGPDGLFYKGLIQLAGAFVHLQKGRAGPAAALLRLARANLQRYPAAHERLDVRAVLTLIERRLEKLEEGGVNPPVEEDRPVLELLKPPRQ